MDGLNLTGDCFDVWMDFTLLFLFSFSFPWDDPDVKGGIKSGISIVLVSPLASIVDKSFSEAPDLAANKLLAFVVAKVF